MGQLCLELTVKSLFIAAAAGAIIGILRIRTSSARHALWTAAMLAMLLLPAWVAWGPKARFEVLPSNDEVLIAAPPHAAKISGSIHRPEAAPTVPARSKWPWRDMAAGIYVFGMGVLLLRLALG